MSFAGIDSTKRAAVEALKNCCAVVAVHFLNNGKALIQGRVIDFPNMASDKEKCKATINILTDTGANEDRIEVTLISQSRQASAFVNMDVDDFIAGT